MADEKMIDRAEHVLYKTYNRFPVVFDHGKGITLWDTEGNEYLDFGAGIAVMGLGYCDEEYTNAVKAQMDKLTHISNLFYNQPSISAGEKLLKVSGMDKVFFTNSGTEAIEGALKIAKRYHYNKLHETMGDGCDGCEEKEVDMTGEIIAMNHSFHGRSIGALSVTGNAHYRTPFNPLLPGVRFANFNDLDSVKAQITDKTCAIIMETIQGEGGIYPATEEFLKGVRALCDEHDLLLILDEIQCGMGRTGKMYTYQHYGVTPDILTTAKALGCGVPVGAFAATEKYAVAMVPGDHGTTYGGNPLATAAICEVFHQYDKLHILDHVNEIAPYLTEKLETLAEAHPDKVKEVRGLGLMQGMELTIPAGDVVAKALQAGVVLISAGTNIIRFVPPLIVEKEHIDKMINVLDDVLSE